jgi:heavy metal efflux system protein
MIDIGVLIAATALTNIIPALFHIIFNRKMNTRINQIIISRAMVMLFISLPFALQAQAPAKPQSPPVIMSLDSVIRVVMNNNPDIQSSRLKVTQQQKLKKTAFDPGKTGIFFENEDLIKNEPDNHGVLKIGVTQTIDFPTTYFAQNKLNIHPVPILD